MEPPSEEAEYEAMHRWQFSIQRREKIWQAASEEKQEEAERRDRAEESGIERTASCYPVYMQV